MCCAYSLCIYKYTHINVYISENMLFIYLFIDELYEINRHVNACKYFQNIYCMCVFIKHNKYTQNTHI